MSDGVTILVKALAGGALVLAFAVLGESLQPKRFAGLLGGAPAVAIAGLTVVVLTKGAHSAREECLGMVAGSVGMVACASTAARLASRGLGPGVIVLGLLAWAAPAAALAAVLL